MEKSYLGLVVRKGLKTESGLVYDLASVSKVVIGDGFYLLVAAGQIRY